MSSSVTLASHHNFDELHWVIQIRQTLEEELEDYADTSVCIFNIPKTLMLSKPVAYIPQQVALGPYHYWRPDLYDMERYKLAAAKRTQKQLQNLKFQNVVDQLAALELKVRCCYHNYLDFNGETLAWMMAVDASFLLEFLQIYAFKEGKILSRVSSRMAHLVDYTGAKSTYNAILRDIILLENQVPLFILKQITEVQYPSIELANDILHSMLIGLCNEISPFNTEDCLPSVQVLDCAHLLDCLYHMIVPKSWKPRVVVEQVDDGQNAAIQDEESFAQPSYVKMLFKEIWKSLSRLNTAPISFVKRVLVSRPVTLVAKLPWTIVTRLMGALLKQDIINTKEDSTSLRNNDKPPLMEEIMIPSVTELSNSGVRFVSTNVITDISFDVKTSTLLLPTVSLDVNTEVVLRNLVAYEASSASGPLVFARYTELMNGIIDTKEDAKLLRENGIILNRLTSDEEVADIWNGMSRSVRLTRVPFLDKAIEDVNKYYNGRWKVKVGKLIKNYVFRSWKFLTFLATILLLLLMTLQSFCSVYKCTGIPLRID